jgi:hypothetical protein
MKTRRPASPQRLVLLFILALGALTAPAAAQGLPFLPDPIKTRDLVVYSDILQLSDQQHAALEPLHDAYLDRFARLRTGDIQDFQDQLLNVALQFQWQTMNIPPRADLEGVLDGWDKLFARIESVDRTLLTDIESILDDEQRPRMDRIRKTRRLQLYERIDLEMTDDLNAGAKVNLTELVTWLDLDEADRIAADEILTNYEGARLSRARRLHQVILDAAVVMLDTIDAMGIRDMTIEEMMAMANDEETITSLRATFDEGSRPFQESAYALSQLNLQTYRRLSERLSDSAAEKLRDSFYKKGYGRAYDGQLPWRGRYEAALQDPDAVTDAPTREQIRFERDRYARQDDQIVDQMVEMLEKHRKYRPSGTLWEMEADPFDDQFEQQQQRRRDLDARADRTLDAILGTSQEQDEATARGKSDRGDSLRVAVASEPKERRDADPDDQKALSEIERILPSPIKLAVLDRWRQQLDWDEGQLAVAEALYDDYRQRYEAIGSGVSDESMSAKEQPDDLLSIRLAAMRDADDVFFDELSMMIGDQRTTAVLERRRQARRRHVYGEMTDNMLRWTGGTIARFDLVDVVYDSELPASVDDLVDTVLVEYEQGVDELFVERFEFAKSAWRRGQLARAARERGAKEVAQSAREKQRELAREGRRRTEQIEAITKEHMTQLLDGLPSQESWDVRHRFNRAAYPDDYDDAEDVEKLIVSALDLSDLDPTQRERIEELSLMFRSRYLDLSDQVIALRQQRKWSEDRDYGPQRDEIEREIEMELLSFQRAELTDRTTVRLQLILTADQPQRVPGLIARNQGRR